MLKVKSIRSLNDRATTQLIKLQLKFMLFFNNTFASIDCVFSYK